MFQTVLDTAWVSLNEAFEQPKYHSDNFNFLHYLSEIDNEALGNKCDDLEICLKGGNNKDIITIELYDILHCLAANNLTFPNFTV